MAPTSAVTIFVRSSQLLVRNPAIVLPGIVAGGFSAFASIVFDPANAAAPSDRLASDLFSRSLAGVAQVLATVFSIAFTTGMADAAWRDRRAGFADGVRAFRRDGGHVFVALLALFALGVAAALLAPFTFALSLLVYAYFGLYTMAAAVVGERMGLAAVAESLDIAFRRPLATLAILATIFGVAAISGVGALLLAGTPYVGPVLQSLIVQSVVAFATLAIVGEYRIAREGEQAA